MTDCCPVVELRQYTLKPGGRDTLIELFDREFLETQDAVGMRVIGQFRDLDRPDRFVWLRGFPDMERRRAGLEAFYGGPVWKAHSEAARSTMITTDDVLLLRPLTPESGFGPLSRRPGVDEDVPASPLVATICPLDGPADPTVVARDVLPALAAAPLAVFVTEPAENTFPVLPVRTGEHVLVWFDRHDTEPPLPDLLPGLRGDPVRLRLAPTARSQLR